MPIHAIVYVSQCAVGLGGTRLEALVKDAARFNEIAGVTGLLLFDGELFLQYLEGPEDGLHAAYERIIGATSHVDVMQLAQGLVGARLVPYWAMTLMGTDRPGFRKLAAADWNSFVRRGNSARPTGVDYLNEMVEQHQMRLGAAH